MNGKPTPIGRITLVTLLILLAAGAAWWLRPAITVGVTSSAQVGSDKAKSASSQTQTRKDGGARPATVEVSEARSGKASDDVRTIGSLLSDESVVLAPEISGRVAEIPFTEGKPIKKGDVLVRLDSELALAEVADAKARLTLAAANNERARILSKTGTVTGRGRDEAVSNFETAQAALALAETKVRKLSLVAPFDGVAGLRGVSVGAFVNAGSPLVNLEKIDTLKVEFKIPEIYLQSVKVGQRLEIQVDAFPGRTFAGEIYAINPLVDVNGRALQIRARLDNKNQELRPGLFVRILIKGLVEREVVFVPEAALVPRGADTFVFLVKDGKAVEQRVRTGLRDNAEVEITDGIPVKTQVVTAGQQKLRNGSPVEVVPSGAPQNRTGKAEETPRTIRERS